MIPPRARREAQDKSPISTALAALLSGDAKLVEYEPDACARCARVFPVSVLVNGVCCGCVLSERA